jgi:hypothetical protein
MCSLAALKTTCSITTTERRTWTCRRRTSCSNAFSFQDRQLLLPANDAHNIRAGIRRILVLLQKTFFEGVRCLWLIGTLTITLAIQEV